MAKKDFSILNLFWVLAFVIPNISFAQPQDNYIYIRVLDSLGSEIKFNDSTSRIYPYSGCNGGVKFETHSDRSESHSKDSMTFVKVKLPVECLDIVHNGQQMKLSLYCFDQSPGINYEMDALGFRPNNYRYTVSLCSEIEFEKGVLGYSNITPYKLRKVKTPIIPVKFIPYRDGDKWGFCSKDKTMLIPTFYDNAWPFKNGLAKVEQKGRQGIIDTTGKIVIPLRYENCRQHEDFIILHKNKKTGVVDLIGNIIIPLEYDNIYNIQNDYWEVSLANKYGTIRSNSEVVIPLEYDDISRTNLPNILRLERDGKWGLFSIEGKQMTNLKYENEPEQKLEFKEGLTAVYAEGKWGYINEKGKEVIKLQFKEAQAFHNGLARVQTDTGSAFIDTKGKIVISSSYNLLSDFYEGLAQIGMIEDNSYIEEKIGYINLEGEIVIPMKYRAATNFHEGEASVMHLGENSWVKIDKEGNIIGNYENYSFYGQLQYIGNNKSFFPDQKYYNVGYINGILVPGPENPKLPYEELFAIIHVLGSSTPMLVNNELFPLGNFQDNWLTFCEDLLTVKKHKWGCVDRTGNTVIDFKYDRPILFVNSLARVVLEGKEGYITPDGQEYFE